MATIRAPFNFVPLSDKVYFPEWAEQISQDVPFKDGEDGIIELEITNKTPLFIRNGHKKDEDEVFSSHIIDSNGNRKYFIPGTSMKGCFRNVMEILSFAKLEQYNDDSFGYRAFTTQIKGLPKLKDIKCGWLYMENDKYYLQECVKGVQKIRHYDIIKSYFSSFNEGSDGNTAQIKQGSFDDYYPVITVESDQLTYKENNVEKHVPAGTYNIVCTGYMKGKKIEYLFSEQLKKTIEVSTDVIKQFESIHKFTPYYGGQNGNDGYLKGQLHSGERIPVFFMSDNDNVVSIGITRMYKQPFAQSIKEVVMSGCKGETKEKWSQYDLPQCVFGTIGDKSIKGRVVVGNAFCEETITDSELQNVYGVLAQPRSSYYPLYLKQDGKTVCHYSSPNIRIAGRKRYRITKDFQIIPLSKGNGNENILTHFCPIPAENKFRCKVSVHNLKAIEIGALLSAITFNNTADCYHNIGQAKAFGYGVISCKINSIRGFKSDVNYYIDAFNKEISFFLKDECNTFMSNNESLNKLASISSPTHLLEDMRQMDFDECESFKEGRNASLLNEASKSITINIDESKVIETRMNEKLEENLVIAENKANLKKWDDAIKLLSNFKLELIKYGLNVGKVEESINKYGDDKQNYENYLVQQEQERKDAEAKAIQMEEQQRNAENRAKKQEAGLAFLLEKRADNGKLKLAELANGVKRANDFIKKNIGYQITDTDKETLHQWLMTLEKPTKKSDLKDYADFEGKSWKELRNWLGDYTAESYHKELNN